MNVDQKKHELREHCSSNIVSSQKLLRSESTQKHKDHFSGTIKHLSELLITGAEADLEHIIQKLMMLHVIYSESELIVKATQ